MKLITNELREIIANRIRQLANKSMNSAKKRGILTILLVRYVFI